MKSSLWLNRHDKSIVKFFLRDKFSSKLNLLPNQASKFYLERALNFFNDNAVVRTRWTDFQNIFFSDITVTQRGLNWAKSWDCGNRFVDFLSYASDFCYYCFNFDLFGFVWFQRQYFLLTLVLKFDPSVGEVNFAFRGGFVPIFDDDLSLKNVSKNSLSKINRIFKYSKVWLLRINIKRNENSMRSSDEDFNMTLVILKISGWFEFYSN